MLLRFTIIGLFSELKFQVATLQATNEYGNVKHKHEILKT